MPIRSGARGWFYTVVDLMSRLGAKSRSRRRERLADHPYRTDSVVLGDLGCLVLARSGGHLLFHLVSRLSKPALVLVTTRTGIGEWPSVSRQRQDDHGLLDCLTHRCEIVETGNKNGRFRNRG